MEWERGVKNDSKVLTQTSARRDFLLTERGPLWQEPEACELLRGANQGSQPSESEVQERVPGLRGPGVGVGGDCTQSVCLPIWAFLGPRPSRDSLRVCDPEHGRPPAGRTAYRRDWLLRESLGGFLARPLFSVSICEHKETTP